MHIVLDLPEQKSDGHELIRTLLTQFAEFQRELAALKTAKTSKTPDTSAPMLQAIQRQHDALMTALERMMTMMGSAMSSHASSDAMVEAVKGLQVTMRGLPKDLKGLMPTPEPMPVESKVSVDLSPLETRLDALQEALMRQPMVVRGLRNRTFGSNY